MEPSSFEEYRKKRLHRIGAWILFAVALFYAAVCTPIYLWSSSDILVKETVFPQIWDFIQSLLQFAFYWIAAAYLVYLVYTDHTRGAARFLVPLAIASCIHWLGSLAVGTAMLGTDFSWEILSEDLFYALFDVLIDMVQFALMLFIAYWYVERKDGREALQNDLPIAKLFDKTNRFECAVFFCVLLPSAIHLISRVRYDISFGAAQNLTDLLWMIFFYLTDLLSILIGYLAVILLIGWIDGKEKKTMEEE